MTDHPPTPAALAATPTLLPTPWAWRDVAAAGLVAGVAWLLLWRWQVVLTVALRAAPNKYAPPSAGALAFAVLASVVPNTLIFLTLAAVTYWRTRARGASWRDLGLRAPLAWGP